MLLIILLISNVYKLSYLCFMDSIIRKKKIHLKLFLAFHTSNNRIRNVENEFIKMHKFAARTEKV